jgi:uncharacterized membrane protein
VTTTSASPLDRHASPVAENRKGGRATASLVLGVLAVIAFLIPILALILGVIGVVLGQTARSACRRAGRAAPWQATAGLVLSCIGIVLGVALWVAAIAANT